MIPSSRVVYRPHPFAPLTVAEFRARLLGTERASVMDLFSGLGGFSIGAVLAGAVLKLAGNHWIRSYETHSLNFGDAEHLLGDLSVENPKRFKRGLANVLICSPECRLHSVARNHREAVAELSHYDPNREAERSRCTMWCPQRFAEWMKFDYVICENVVEVRRWNRFPDWLREWDKLGYNVQVVCANSAFFGNEQSRDRAFFVISRKGLPLPNLDFRPPGWCWTCERDTFGVQTWRPAALRNATPIGPMGKFGPRNQYEYRCETCGDVCAPYVEPACQAIDWSIEAPAIGDRARLGLRPLVENTMKRLERGKRRMGYVEQLVVNGEARPVWLPAMGQRASGLVAPERAHSLVYMRNNVMPTAVDAGPALAVCASGNHHGLLGAPHGHPRAYLAAYNGSGDNMRSIDDPAGALVTTDRHALLVPSVGEAPGNDFDLEEATYRMLCGPEAVRLMGAHERPDGSEYVVSGNGTETVRQAGNAIVPIVGANVLDRCLSAA